MTIRGVRNLHGEWLIVVLDGELELLKVRGRDLSMVLAIVCDHIEGRRGLASTIKPS